MLRSSLICLMLTGLVTLSPQADAQVAAARAFQPGATDGAYFIKANRYQRWNFGAPRAVFHKPRAMSQWSGLGPHASKIVAATNLSSGRIHFFLADATYLTYDLRARRTVQRTPQRIDATSWPGLRPYARQIRAALHWNAKQLIFFLADGRYVVFDVKKNRVLSTSPKPVTNKTWPGLGPYATKIEAAVPWNNKSVYFFLDDGRYLRYSVTADRVMSGFPRATNASNWPGLGRFFGRPVARMVSSRRWQGRRPLRNGAKIALKVHRRMEGPIRTGPNSQVINQFVTAKPLLMATHNKMSAATTFEVRVLARNSNERIRGNTPGRYQKIVLKASNGKYVGVSQARGGLILANKSLNDATIFVLDLTRGMRTGLYVYEGLISYAYQDRVPATARLHGTYFFSYGYHSAFSVMRRPLLVAGSVIEIYFVR